MTVKIILIEDEAAAGYPNTCRMCYHRDAAFVIIWTSGSVSVCHTCARHLRDALVNVNDIQEEDA